MTDPLTPVRLAEIKARIPAGQHPWRIEPRIVGYEGGQEEREEGFEIWTNTADGEWVVAEVHDEWAEDEDTDGGTRVVQIDATHDVHPDAASIAQFILHAQHDVPALLGEVDRLSAELAEARADRGRLIAAILRLKQEPRIPLEAWYAYATVLEMARGTKLGLRDGERPGEAQDAPQPHPEPPQGAPVMDFPSETPVEPLRPADGRLYADGPPCRHEAMWLVPTDGGIECMVCGPATRTQDGPTAPVADSTGSATNPTPTQPQTNQGNRDEATQP